MSDDKVNMFKQLAEQRKQKSEPTPKELQLSPKAEKAKPVENAEKPKRGRPATGKRSDPDWLGRTYYIRKKTDLDIEGELHNLKRSGVEIDKSELVDFLLGEWVKSRKGEKATFQIGENS